MKNNQNISLLFWHRKSKQDKNGYAPIICRISIKGGPKAEIAIGKKAHFDEWDLDKKKAKGKDKETKEINLKISELTVDLNRHFILLQGRYEKITALMLKNVYLGKPAKQQKVVNKSEKLIEKKSSIPPFCKRSIHILQILKRWLKRDCAPRKRRSNGTQRELN